MPRARILAIDDEQLVRFTLQEILVEAGYEVIEASSGKLGLEILAKGGVDVVITDIVMPEMDGNAVIAKIQERWPDLPIIAISGSGRTMTHNYLAVTRELGVKNILTKPFSKNELLEAVEHFVGRPESCP